MNSHSIFLAQTDTTVGFASQNLDKLYLTKQRSHHKKILRLIHNFNTLQSFVRIPHHHKHRIRHSKKTTFIFPQGEAFRYIHHLPHQHNFLTRFSWIYSSSANKSGKEYDPTWAKIHSDVHVIDSRGIYESQPSQLLKLSRHRIKKIR